jgi:hypothetical protein
MTDKPDVSLAAESAGYDVDIASVMELAKAQKEYH